MLGLSYNQPTVTLLLPAVQWDSSLIVASKSMGVAYAKVDWIYCVKSERNRSKFLYQTTCKPYVNLHFSNFD